MTGVEEGNGGLFVWIQGAGAPDNRKASGSWQTRLERLDGIDRYGSLVEASVAGIDWLDMGKRGVVWAIFKAAL